MIKSLIFVFLNYLRFSHLPWPNHIQCWKKFDSLHIAVGLKMYHYYNDYYCKLEAKIKRKIWRFLEICFYSMVWAASKGNPYDPLNGTMPILNHPVHTICIWVRNRNCFLYGAHIYAYLHFNDNLFLLIPTEAEIWESYQSNRY